MSKKHILEIQSFRLPDQDWKLSFEQQQYLKNVAAQCGGKEESVLCLCHHCAPQAVEAFKKAAAPPRHLWCNKQKVKLHLDTQLDQGPELAAEVAYAKEPHRADAFRWLSHRTYLQLVLMAIVRDGVPASYNAQQDSQAQHLQTPTADQQVLDSSDIEHSCGRGEPNASPDENSSGTDLDSEWSGSEESEPSPKRRKSAAAKVNPARPGTGYSSGQHQRRLSGAREAASKQGPWKMAPQPSIKQQWLDAFQASGLRNRSEKDALAECYESEGIAIDTLPELEDPVEDALAIVSHVVGNSFALRSLLKKLLKDLLVNQEGGRTHILSQVLSRVYGCIS